MYTKKTFNIIMFAVMPVLAILLFAWSFTESGMQAISGKKNEIELHSAPDIATRTPNSK